MNTETIWTIHSRIVDFMAEALPDAADGIENVEPEGDTIHFTLDGKPFALVITLTEEEEN